MEKEKKTTLQIYIVFTISVILSFVPSAIASSFGAILLLIMVGAIYFYKSKYFHHICNFIEILSNKFAITQVIAFLNKDRKNHPVSKYTYIYLNKIILNFKILQSSKWALCFFFLIKIIKI